MTHVALRPLNDGYLFSCEGHAGYAEKGKDIVCAGISALCMALCARLEDMSLQGMVHLSQVSASDGELTLRAETESGDKMSALLLACVFETVMAGLTALEADYPDYLIVT